MTTNNILISDTKERLFSTVNVIKLNYPVMLTKESPPNVGRYALGTIYYVHICPQGRILSSSVIKRLNVFLRKKVQTLPTNHSAKYVSLSARHCLLLRLCPRDNFFYFVNWRKKVGSPFLPNPFSMCFTTDLKSCVVPICHKTGRGFTAHIWASLPIYAALHFSDGTSEAKILLKVHWPGYNDGAKDSYSILGQCSLKWHPHCCIS